MCACNASVLYPVLLFPYVVSSILSSRCLAWCGRNSSIPISTVKHMYDIIIFIEPYFRDPFNSI
ncbi:hypothetical protein ES288_D05G376100v1 [Gossypium darwinii]|uniref:Uncharacterized protein n=1 Tax=Gossypium darwinii TaxID=34276 RepID=A0A5D2CT30_GOSDA|nr:hypothetical protein ES288_D05G376100v1 [Gossypium darwinii]